MKIANISIQVFVACLLCAGCASSPRGGDVLDLRTLSRDFWLIKSRTESVEQDQARIAVVEFTLEYVPEVKSAAGADDLDFGKGMELELPGILFQEFVDIFPEFNRRAVSLDEITGAKSFQGLKGTPLDSEKLVSGAINHEASNGEGLRYPVEGLLALEDGPETDAAIRGILKETGAVSALQVRWKVGIRDGRASIEKGSTIRVINENGVGLLETRQTLVSAKNVVEEDEGARAVDSTEYVKAIRNLFTLSTAMGIVAMESST